jgi:hypothetical protein
VFVHFVRYGRKNLEANELTDLKNGATKPTKNPENS